MKRIVSLVLVCLLVLSSVCTFANDGSLEGNVKELQTFGILQGDPDGNIRLDDELTRAEAVTLIVRLYGFEPETSSSVTFSSFSDMENHWAHNAVAIAENLRIVSSENDKEFSPSEKITAQEFLKMTVCLLGYKEVAEKKAPDYIGYILQASQSGITKDVPLITDKPITRRQAVKIICNSLDVPLMVQTSFGVNNEYIIMNGKNGTEYQTLRTSFEEK